MFSCRQAVRQTFDMLERRLSPAERMSRRSHLALCRHCRAHSRQVRGLFFFLKRQDTSVEPSLPRLSPEARVRIAAAVAENNQK
jgi:hypothetical protein